MYRIAYITSRCLVCWKMYALSLGPGEPHYALFQLGEKKVCLMETEWLYRVLKGATPGVEEAPVEVEGGEGALLRSAVGVVMMTSPSTQKWQQSLGKPWATLDVGEMKETEQKSPSNRTRRFKEICDFVQNSDLCKVWDPSSGLMPKVSWPPCMFLPDVFRLGQNSECAWPLVRGTGCLKSIWGNKWLAGLPFNCQSGAALSSAKLPA